MMAKPATMRMPSLAWRLRNDRQFASRGIRAFKSASTFHRFVEARKQAVKRHCARTVLPTKCNSVTFQLPSSAAAQNP